MIALSRPLPREQPAPAPARWSWVSPREAAVIARMLMPGQLRPSALAAFEDRQLRALVRHAYEKVPYYRWLFDDAGVRPEHIRTRADLELVPITTKKDLKSLPLADRVARGVDASRLVSHATGGSSGEPFVIRRTWAEERVLAIVRHRLLRPFRIDRHDRIAIIVYLREPDPNNRHPLHWLFGYFWRREGRVFHCLQDPAELANALMEYRPTLIGGYAGVLARLAQSLSAVHRAAIRPRLVLSGGEVLTQAQRRDLSLAFGTPVFDTYGCHEFGRIATECTNGGGYHVSAEGVLVQVSANGREVEPGERGEVIGTNLHAFAMPFIRYRLGDLVTRGADRCSCGLPVPTINSIQGRMVDFFPLADGRTIHPYEVAAAAKQHLLDWIGEYQFLQERADRVVLRAVPRRPPRLEEVRELRASVQRVLGPAVSFDVHLLSELELGWRGKFRVYRSLVRSDYDESESEEYGAVTP